MRSQKRSLFLFRDFLLVGRADFIDYERGYIRRHAAPEDDGAEAVKEKEEEKGRIILVNALPALTSATSRCTRPTRDQIPSKLRERTDASRRVQLHRTVPYDGSALPMQLKSISVARDRNNIAVIYVAQA